MKPGDHEEGERVGDYQVVRPLDPSGGMGRKAAMAVHKAGDAPGRLFIIKRLEATGPRARKAQSELENVSRLRHLANVKLVEHFTHKKELVVVFDHAHEGPRLDQIQGHLERQNERFADGATLFLAHQLLNALAEAHEQEEDGKSLKMVHGHLGPDLVRITWEGRVRLVGLGMPSLFDDAGRASAVLAYRPPEYKLTRIGDASGDVYSICAMLWALFTGRRPPEDAKGFPKLSSLRPDIPASVAAAIDKGLKRTPLLRKITCREIAKGLEKEVRSIADATELKWNMEVFRALSLFAGSVAPPASVVPGDSSPPPDDADIPVPIPSRPSGTGPQPALGWKSSEQPSKGGSSDDSVIKRLSDLFDALPADASDAGEPKERTSVDAGWEIEDDTEEREAERFSEVGDPPPSQRKPTPPPPTTEPEPEIATIPAGDSAPPTEPEPETEPSAEGARPTRAEGKRRSPPIPPVPAPPKISTKPSTAPVSSEPVPSTEPEPGRMASPPPSLNTHLLASSDETPAPSPAPVVRQGVSKANVAAIGVVCIGLGFVAAWLLKPPAGGPPPTTTTTSPSPQPPEPVKKPTPSAKPAPPKMSATPDGSAAPSREPADSAELVDSAEPAAPQPPGDLPPMPAGDGRDGSKLLSYQGYLIVRSPAKAQVFAQGINIGNTNEKIMTRCRQKNVRLRSLETWRWITKGQPIEITCMATTTVVIHPDPE